MATYYSSWNSKSYSWGTAKTRCRLVLTTSQSNTAVRISISGAVQCDSTYNISDYGVRVTVGNKSASGASAHSDTGDGVFDGGTGWKASASTSCSATRKTSAYSVSCYSKYAGRTVSGYGGCLNRGSVTKSVSVPALTSYKVTYNANGGSGAPSTQTKYYGKTLTLSSTKPTRTGYTFQGWGTSASDTSVNYAAGANYTSNAAVTLYAIWKANTYTITYNANGGSGAPANQTKTYGQTLTLSTTKPTRTNYNFLGWATSASASTATYQAGGSYTTNAAATLYAVWELAYIPPTVTNLQVDRCTSSGALSESGTYAKVAFNWKTDNKAVSSITIGYKLSTATNYTKTTVSASGTSGTVNKVIGSNNLSTEYVYNVQVEVADAQGSSTYTATINSLDYIIDFHVGGDGVAIGKPSTAAGFAVGMNTTFEKPVTFSGTNTTFEKPVTFSGIATHNAAIQLANNIALGGKNTSGGIINLLKVNSSNQVELDWTSGGMRGRVFKRLWSGSWSANGTSTINVPEAPYYNLFLLKFSGRDARILAIRNITGNGGSIMGTAAYTTGVANSFTRYAVSIKINGTTLSDYKSVYAYDDSAAVGQATVLTSIEGVL